MLVFGTESVNMIAPERQSTGEVIRSIFNDTPDPVVIIKESGEIAYVNAAAVRRYGYSQEEFLKMRIHALAADHLRDKVPLHLPGADRGVEQFDWVHRTKDGREIPVDIYTQPIVYEGGRARLSSFRDARERKANEQLLRLQSTILTNMASGLCLVAAGSGTIVYASSVFEDMLGYATGELVGQPVAIINAPTDKSPEEIADDINAAVSSDGHWSGEIKNLCKDGRTIWCSLIVTVFEHWEYGRVWLSVSDNVTGVYLARQERNAALTRLISALADKDALIKEVHHRVKNNLQVISSLLRLESRRLKNTSAKEVLETMNGRIQAMAQLHESLYRSGNVTEVDLSAYLGAISKQVYLTTMTNENKVRLKVNIGSVRVNTDRAIACGLLVNELVSNCLKHGFPEGRTGEIWVELQPVDAANVQVDGLWRLCVRDNGIGLPADFEERRKDSLGLLLAGDICRQAGGTLDIQSQPNQGTEFSAVFKMPALMSA